MLYRLSGGCDASGFCNFGVKCTFAASFRFAPAVRSGRKLPGAVPAAARDNSEPAMAPVPARLPAPGTLPAAEPAERGARLATQAPPPALYGRGRMGGAKASGGLPDCRPVYRPNAQKAPGGERVPVGRREVPVFGRMTFPAGCAWAAARVRSLCAGPLSWWPATRDRIRGAAAAATRRDTLRRVRPPRAGMRQSSPEYTRGTSVAWRGTPRGNASQPSRPADVRQENAGRLKLGCPWRTCATRSTRYVDRGEYPVRLPQACLARGERQTGCRIFATFARLLESRDTPLPRFAETDLAGGGPW